MDTAATAPKPRLIVELQPDGSYVIESYTNGQRLRDQVAPYFLEMTIVDELKRQKRSIELAAEEKRIRQEREEAARHRRVWWGVAAGTGNSRGHGIAFANKTVGRMARTPKEPAAPALPVATIDVL